MIPLITTASHPFCDSLEDAASLPHKHPIRSFPPLTSSSSFPLSPSPCFPPFHLTGQWDQTGLSGRRMTGGERDAGGGDDRLARTKHPASQTGRSRGTESTPTAMQSVVSDLFMDKLSLTELNFFAWCIHRASGVKEEVPEPETCTGRRGETLDLKHALKSNGPKCQIKIIWFQQLSNTDVWLIHTESCTMPARGRRFSDMEMLVGMEDEQRDIARSRAGSCEDFYTFRVSCLQFFIAIFEVEKEVFYFWSVEYEECRTHQTGKCCIFVREVGEYSGISQISSQEHTKNVFSHLLHLRAEKQREVSHRLVLNPRNEWRSCWKITEVHCGNSLCCSQWIFLMHWTCISSKSKLIRNEILTFSDQHNFYEAM